jgi:hypothetical protein
MTDTITLPRAVVEMAAERLREAIGVYAECPEDIAALNALEAALDAALAEPKKVTPSTPVQYGWLCPACGRGNAPLAQTCSCKGWPSLQITCGPATMTGGT